LPKLEEFFGAVRREILNGKGFILFKGVPVQEWGLEKSATAYVALGLGWQSMFLVRIY